LPRLYRYFEKGPAIHFIESCRFFRRVAHSPAGTFRTATLSLRRRSPAQKAAAFRKKWTRNASISALCKNQAHLNWGGGEEKVFLVLEAQNLKQRRGSDPSPARWPRRNRMGSPRACLTVVNLTPRPEGAPKPLPP
ncbi:hypothetical protein E2320_002023, partial [Naja naja]